MTSATWHVLVLLERIGDFGGVSGYEDSTGTVFIGPHPVQVNDSKTRRGRCCK